MIEIATARVEGTSVRVSGQNIPFGLIGGYITIDYVDSVWNGLVKTVVFRGSQTIDVVTQDTRVKIPVEVLQKKGKRIYVGFYGTDRYGEEAIPTIWGEIGTVVEATDPSGDDGADPTLPIWAQLAGQVAVLTEAVNNSSSFRPDETLTLKDGVLSVNTTDLMERDNTLPITSAGVYATVGNIEALLNTI